MQIKVEIRYELWPYERSISVTIPSDEVDKLDNYVDSITSNLKMEILSHIRREHPAVWYQKSPLKIEQLKDLQNGSAVQGNSI